MDTATIASSPSTPAQIGDAQGPIRPPQRINSIDIVRGIVVVLMAIDHVRVYSGVPAGGPSFGVFFTRWITHFVAPAFAFLAGTSAWLHGQKLADRGRLARFLLSRGAWLIFLELTFLRVAWTFNFDFAHYMLAGVIWMLGWCMIALAAILWLPLPVITTLALAIILGHNILDLFAPTLVPWITQQSWSWLAQILYYGGQIQIDANGPPLDILYSLFPWVGVMAAGYAFGTVLSRPSAERRRFCLFFGAAAILAFLVLRGFDLYGDPRPWNHAPRTITHRQQPPAPPAGQAAQNNQASARPARPAPTRPNPVLRFLNTTKYPASLLFLCMTLGPMLLLLTFTEQMTGQVSRWLATFGRVPMFYYLLHIPLIHILALLVVLVRTPNAIPWLLGNHPMEPPPLPDGYMWPLWLLYLIWAVAVVLLYFPCRWYARVKARSRNKWLSYI